MKRAAERVAGRIEVLERERTELNRRLVSGSIVETPQMRIAQRRLKRLEAMLGLRPAKVTLGRLS
jgi:hypothetical protein